MEDVAWDILPLLPLEQNRAVLCPNSQYGCLQYFPTYSAANAHDVNYCDYRLKDGIFSCPWGGCDRTFSSRKLLHHHHSDHPGGEYLCRRGCGKSWPNEYLLVNHEDGCVGKVIGSTRLLVGSEYRQGF
ncbi:hypothetical protein BDV95DRAFT_121220 [Massariosphaeria phaeospora]|uniref:C2H2-type domain-containing protein n=1 Tax=Massariosphaeria phaeospora TaxID=100035 RepID=A0A7C8M6G2_9PLEO|nr:hypothetical protein BDV95DRAFT_121220 [Massariosphaeria phaeospora]